MDRRTVLAATGTLTAGVPTLASGQSSDSESPDCSTIKPDTDPGDPDPAYSDESGVPTAWWEHAHRAEQVRRTLEREYTGTDWFRGSELFKGERLICGLSNRIIVINVRDHETAQQYLDDERDGIEVRTTEEPPTEVHSSQEMYNSDEFREMSTDVDNSRGSDGGNERDSGSDGTDSARSGDSPMPEPGILGALAGLVGGGWLLDRRDDEERGT